jgi:6-phosphogluconolactonase
MNPAERKPYRWHAVPDENALQQQALTLILAQAARAIHERGQFHVVLAGGNTPRGVYRQLGRAQTDWSAWHVYFGDERCVPPDDPARNYHMAAEAWLNQVAIPATQVHPIPGELGAVQASQRYAEALEAVGDFDLVLLGLGEDGHTASLFPDHDWGAAPGAPDTLAVFDAPKPPRERVSLSATRLSRTREVLFLVSGEAKRWAISQWLADKDIPASSIKPATGVDVLVESALLTPIPDPGNRTRNDVRMKSR